MRFAGTQTVISCREYEDINIPVADLMREDGQIDLYPETSTHGYFDIAFKDGQLKLRARGTVGLIPISDNLAIHVRPRAPIGNLLYMMWRAGERLEGLSDFIRGYQVDLGKADNVEELYVSTFLSALKGIRGGGLLKRYVERDTDKAKRGRLLLGPTVSRFRASGQRHRHIFRFHELTVDNRENQILKRTVGRLAEHFLRDPVGPNLDVARELRQLQQLFNGVDDSGVTDQQVANSAIPAIRALPRHHQHYEPALWLAYLIATKSGVVMERIGQARFESLIVDMADVFENYIRTLMQEAGITHFGGCTVLDGNKRSLPLFTTTSQFSVKPDYYMQRGGRFVATADAKYKPSVSEQDRYALLAFADALGVHRCAFVCPMFGEELLTLHQGTTPRGVEIHLVRIDLSAENLADEEEAFKERMATALGLGPAA